MGIAIDSEILLLLGEAILFLCALPSIVIRGMKGIILLLCAAGCGAKVWAYWHHPVYAVLTTLLIIYTGFILFKSE